MRTVSAHPCASMGTHTSFSTTATGTYVAQSRLTLLNYSGTQTRGNNLKIYQDHVHYNRRKYSFSYRVIHVWNSLPNEVIEANSSFKNRLDKHWYNELNSPELEAVVKFLV